MVYKTVKLIGGYVSLAEQRFKTSRIGATANLLAELYLVDLNTSSDKSPAAYAFLASHLYLLLAAEIAYTYLVNSIKERTDDEPEEAEAGQSSD